MLFFPYMLLLFLDGRYGGHRAPADPTNRCILKSRDHELFNSFGFESLDVRALEDELTAGSRPKPQVLTTDPWLGGVEKAVSSEANSVALEPWVCCRRELFSKARMSCDSNPKEI